MDYNQFIASGGAVDTSQVKLETPGIYPVTYALNGVTSTAYLTVLEEQLVVKGDSLKRFVGDPIPEDSEFNAVGKDYSGASLPVTINKSREDMSKAGIYAVFLTITSLERPNLTFTTAVTVNVMDKQTTIKAHDSTIYVGDKWSAQDNFDSALDKDGNAVDYSQVEVDASQVDTTKPGIYSVMYTYEGVTTTAKVTVKAKQTTNPTKPSDSTNGGKKRQIVSPHSPDGSKKAKNEKVYYTKHKEDKYNLNGKQFPKTGEKSSVFPIIVGILTLVLFSITLLF